MFITDALALSHVPRWSIVHIRRPQSVAEHCFNVAVIAREILSVIDWREGDPLRAYPILWYALVHDLDECRTGDIPSTAKKYFDPRKLVFDTPVVDISLDELHICKLADHIEAYTYLTKHGSGPHAFRVLHESVKPALDAAILDTGIDPNLIWELVNRIITEEGR